LKIAQLEEQGYDCTNGQCVKVKQSTTTQETEVLETKIVEGNIAKP